MHFLGGVVKKASAEVTSKLNEINRQLIAIDDKKELANSPLWEELKEAMGIKNHYHFTVGVNAGLEANQDFSSKQFAYGAQFRFSAKAYSDKNPLAQLNILDYPFALIRFLTGTDARIEPYGAALPVITLGIDRVKPSDDEERKILTGNEKEFTRFRFEAGFRTLLTSVDDFRIYFNSAYRFFNEISPSDIIRQSKLNKFSYFTASISGADTYFVSYSYGKLPFDRSDNAIYEIGFRLNF